MSTFPQDYCVVPQSNGGSGGSSFSFYVNGGKAETKLPDDTIVQSYYTISKISTWVSDHRMQGIQIWLSNSSTGYSDSNPSHFYGKTGGTLRSYVFQPGELITALSIYNTKYNDKHYCGGLYFKTSLGGIYSNISGGSAESMNVGAGLCVGIFGKSGDVVDNLGFWMVSNPYAIALTNVSYVDSPQAPQKNIILQQSHKNAGSDPSTYTFQESYTSETQESWTIVSTSQASVSLSVEVSAEVYSVTTTVGADAT